jgi:hypothetical protein
MVKLDFAVDIDLSLLQALAELDVDRERSASYVM